MIVVVAYDIREDRRRSRVAAVLQAFGDRVQRSVFILDLTPEGLEEVRRRVRVETDENSDSVYFMRQCVRCWDQLDVCGQAAKPEKVLHWAVL